MYLLAVGINYQSAPAEIRDKMAGEEINLPEFLAMLNRFDRLAGCVILPTSSGIEIYTSTRDLSEAVNTITELLSLHYGVDGLKLKEYLQVYTLNDCIRHLFRVIGGLDGGFENAKQAFRQAGESYNAACKNGAANNVLCTLFEKAIKAVKTVLDEVASEDKAQIEAGIERQLDHFLKWLNSGFVAPTVAALNGKGDIIREKELTRALNRLNSLNEEEQEIVKSLAESIVTELLRDPVEKIQDFSATAQGHLYTEILRNLFNLKTEKSGNVPIT